MGNTIGLLLQIQINLKKIPFELSVSHLKIIEPRDTYDKKLERFWIRYYLAINE